jgi:hypothetical protein
LPASDTGLVGYWAFDEGAGTTMTDFSGYENAGTLVNGPAYIYGKFAYGLSFDGVDDSVAVPHSDSLNLKNELTISAWIYNQAAHDALLQNSEYHIIAAKGWAPGSGGSWTLAWDKKTNNLLFFVRKSSDGGYRYAKFDSSSLTNDWHLITAVFNRGKIRLYVDGLLVAGPVALGTTSIKTNTDDIRIGSLDGNPSSAHHNWDGHVDEVQIYNRALTDTEIEALAEINPGYQAAEAQAAFDFTVASSGDLSVPKKSATFTNINASLISGTAQPVSFVFSGMPSGTKASFSSLSCTPTCTTILSIQTTSDTRIGTYSITVTAKAGTVQKSTSFKLSVLRPAVATPVITPNGGTYASPVSVTLKTLTSNASIYYTTDGTSPT